MVNCSNILKPLLSSHLWHVMEEVTYSAIIIYSAIVVWFFASREQNIYIDLYYLTMITFSSFIFSYILGIPFYIFIERPYRNFLDLIVFPKSTIFKKVKDVEDEDTDDSNEDLDDTKTNKSSGKNTLQTLNL